MDNNQINNNQVENNQVNNNQVESNQVNNIQIENNPVNNNQIPIPSTSEQKQKEPAGSPVGTIFLLLIVVGIVGAIFLNKESLSNKKAEEPAATVKEQKAPEEEKAPAEEEKAPAKKDENKDESKKPVNNNYNQQFLDNNKDTDEATVSVNGKQMTIKKDIKEEEYGNDIERLYINGQKIAESDEGIYNIGYQVFKSAKDNKEYLFVSYLDWGAYDYFIADSGEIIKKIDSEMKNEENCYYSTDEAFENDKTLTTVKDGFVYYYIYKESSGELDYENIDLYEVKASIENNQFKDEGETGTKIKGIAANCE